MKPFFKTTLAAALGVILASIVCSILCLFIVIGIVGSSEKTTEITPGSILEINFEGSLLEYNQQEMPDFMGSLTGGSQESIGLDEILSAIKAAADNENICGIYLNCGQMSAGLASYSEIRHALCSFKESGKFVYAYANETMYQGVYYACSSADSIFLNPSGMMMFSGMASTLTFYADVFKKIGVEPQVFKVGTYKSAVEPYTNTEMSRANREQMTSYLNGMWSYLLAGVSEGRGMCANCLNKVADSFPMLQKSQFLVDNGLVDSLFYESDMKQLLAEKAGCTVKDLHLVSVKELNKQPVKGQKYQPDKVAVLYAAGQINSGSAAGINLGGEQITDKALVEEIEKLQEDSHVKAVVMRVNSPGGSAFASEQICEAVKRLKATKPVVVSMGDYAASGGYYISSHADKIVASPATLTGSIGIFGLSFNAEKLAAKAGFHLGTVKTNAYADFGNTLMRSMTPGEKALMQQYIEAGYDLFVERCATGRGMADADIRKIAEGRVWTGTQGLEIGLVDTLGYINDAIELAAGLAGVEDYGIVSYPQKKDFMTQLMEELSGNTSLKVLARRNRLDVNDLLEIDFLRANSGVMARMPYSIDIH